MIGRFFTEKFQKKNNKSGFFNGIITISLFGVLVSPTTLSAFTYDDYLLTTEQVGKTLAQGISAGAENTQALYQSAWNELTSQGSTLMLPKVYLRLQEAGRQVEPLLNSYVEYSNNLGTSFANTLTQGMGVSQEFSQKIWNQNPTVSSLAKVGPSFSSYVEFSQNMGETYADTFTAYVTGTDVVGDALAGGMRNGLKNSAALYTNLITKEKSLAVNTITDTTQSLASISSTINSISTSIGNFWNSFFEPRSDLKEPQGRTLTPVNTQPTNQPPTIVTPP